MIRNLYCLSQEVNSEMRGVGRNIVLVKGLLLNNHGHRLNKTRSLIDKHSGCVSGSTVSR